MCVYGGGGGGAVADTSGNVLINGMRTALTS